MSLATDLQGIKTKTGTLETDLRDIKNALKEQEVKNVDNIKISDVDEKISEINAIFESKTCKQYVFSGNDYTKNVIFTDQKAPSGVSIVNFAEKNDRSIVKWAKDDTTYISTQKEGVKIVLPKVCSYMFCYKTSISNSNSTTTSIDFSNVDTSNVTDMSSMFYNCRALTTLNLSSFDTSKVTNMNQMFYRCEVLTTLNLSSFDTSRVRDMNSMFYNCKALTTLDLSSFDTSKVTNMSYMFYQTYISTLDLSNFDTSSVTNMNSMFYQCTELTTLNLSSFNTSSVTNMYNMFYCCKALTTLDLSNFDTSSVINMKNMFIQCETLTALDLSSFDTSNVTDMSYMFFSCWKLSAIYAKEWNKISSDTAMFGNCSKLPNYISSKQDGSMAKWTTNGGYFTFPSNRYRY